MCKHGAFLRSFFLRLSGSRSAPRFGRRPPPGPLPCPLCHPGSGNIPFPANPAPAPYRPACALPVPFSRSLQFSTRPHIFGPDPREAIFLTPCLKRFCGSAPAEDHARVRRTRAHARKNFAPGWAGAWAGAAARVWFARVLKLSACCPGPVICWAVCGHGGRPGHGGACPLACAAAWAVRPAPGPACVHGRVSLPACFLGYARRLWPQSHPRRTTPRPEACPLPPIRGLPAALPAPPGLQPGRPSILQARPPAAVAHVRRRGFMRPVWCPGSLSYMPPYNPPKYSILHRKSPRKFVQKNFPTSPL